MADLHAFFELAVLDLDKIADFDVFGQFGAGAQAGIGADHSAARYMAAFQMAERADRGS